MAYHPLKRFKRQELRDELDLAISQQLDDVVRGEISSDEARQAFLQTIAGGFGRRAILKHRRLFQRCLLIRVLAGIPDPAEDDLELALGYLRRRVLKGTLSLAEAKERVSRATRFLDADMQEQWRLELESELMGSNGPTLRRPSLRT